MKKIKFLTFAIVIAIIAISCNNTSSTSNADDKMKDIAADAASMKSYVIEYKMVMSAEQVKSTTTMTQWIDMGNDRFAMESVSETEMMGTKQSGKSLIIDDGEWSYMIDPATKSGFKSKSGEGEDDPTDMIKSDDEVTFRQMIEKDGGKVLANESFLGKDCIVVELMEKNDDGKSMPTKMWYYKGIPLKMVNSLYTMEATKFEENVSIPASRFEVPAGITLSEMPSMPE
jgi:outer membrane lipoprotein-sorting protein